MEYQREARATGESSDVELIAGPVIFSVQHNGSPVMSHNMATWQTMCTDQGLAMGATS